MECYVLGFEEGRRAEIEGLPAGQGRLPLLTAVVRHKAPALVKGAAKPREEEWLKVCAGGGNLNEVRKPDLTSREVRFTAKGKAIYAFVMGWPGTSLTITSRGYDRAPEDSAKVVAVQLLLQNENLVFMQDDSGLL